MNNYYYIIRHGESVLNKQGRHQGWIARNPLTEKGRLQAKETAEKLKNKGIDLIFASPLLRTKQTAKIIAESLKLSVHFSEKIKENNQSRSWEGLPTEEYKQLPSYLLWKQNSTIDPHFHLPDGESPANFEARNIAFAQWLDKKYQNKRIAIVVHNGNFFYLVRHWTRIELTLEEMKNAIVYKVIGTQKRIESI